jgi:hypothetical protein
MKPHLLLTLLAAALVALVLPLAASARVDSDGGLPTPSTVVQQADDEADDDADAAETETAGDEQGEDDELEHEGTITLGTDSVLVTDEHGGVTSCAVPAGVDLSAFAGQEVEIKCEQVNGVWTVVRVKSEDGETEIEVGDVDNSGPGNAEDDDSEDNSGPGSVDDDSEDNSGPGHVDDDDNDNDTPSVDDNDDDHSGPGGGGDDDEEEDD